MGGPGSGRRPKPPSLKHVEAGKGSAIYTQPPSQQDALTDAELRATPVSVTDTNPPQTDALTDAELRATPVSVTDTNPPQTDALTDAELRATPINVRTRLDPPSTTSGRTHVQASATASGTLYTVPAGKTLYITSAWVTGTNTSAGSVTASITGASTILRCHPASPPSVGASHGSARIALSFPEPWQVPAGTTVTLGGTAVAIAGGFTGWVE